MSWKPLLDEVHGECCCIMAVLRSDGFKDSSVLWDPPSYCVSLWSLHSIDVVRSFWEVRSPFGISSLKKPLVGSPLFLGLCHR